MSTSSGGNRAERRHSITIKNISAKNAQQLRVDALRLVSEGVVQLEVDSNAAYERQGNMAYYSEENLAQRLAIRNHPLLKRLTCALWRLVVTSSAPMDFDGYTMLLIRLHKILMEHFNADVSYVQIRLDWDSDTKGQVALAYNAFHLSLFELVDLWCDSIHVDDYISLLYLILDGISRVEDSTFKLRALEDILYTDVVDVALQRTLREIEAIMATMIIEPVDNEYDNHTQPPDQLVPKLAIPLHSGTNNSFPDLAPHPTSNHASIDVGVGLLNVSCHPAHLNPSLASTPQLHTLDPQLPFVSPSLETFEPLCVQTNPQLHLDSPPRPLALDDKDRHILTSIPSLTPWGDDPPMLPREKGTPKQTTSHQSSFESHISLRQLSTSATATAPTPPTFLHHNSSSIFRQMSVLHSSPTSPGPAAAARVYVPIKPVKATQPLEQREFGGFSIKSPREVAPPHHSSMPAKQIAVSSRLPNTTFVGALSTATLLADSVDETRIEDIRKAFQGRKRQSFVRKRTPPRLGILDTNPPGVSAAAAPTSLPQKDTPKQGKPKRKAIEKMAVDLVMALASSTLGAALVESPTGMANHGTSNAVVLSHMTPKFRTRQLAKEEYAPEPPQNITGVVPTSKSLPPTHRMVDLAAQYMDVGGGLLPPRPSGATKHLLPRWRRTGAQPVATTPDIPPVVMEVCAVQVVPKSPHPEPTHVLPRLGHRPDPIKSSKLFDDTTPTTRTDIRSAVSFDSPSVHRGTSHTSHHTVTHPRVRGHLYHSPPSTPTVGHDKDSNIALPAIEHHHIPPKDKSSSYKEGNEARQPTATHPTCQMKPRLRNPQRHGGG
ncbi:hypothetical protein H257_03249 [Aphanomyces astaci]|uniref:Uncharacterized protein n=1 Tax=Aphanomyces astaci TaxID=112090 RepID=W4H0W4_APHAT|nr:hypothetical protein H257_03249 [Aphanomyces astaci]ETV85537.1 hypothetical protein H257_03249 [Aphanomyces astaci]|eukprot:XP_009825555.1 hypothetical protein H257_03249 [Aphanomyces astaci]